MTESADFNIKLYQNDLPDDLNLGQEIALDTEAMGLNPHRDRLCLVQLSSGQGVCHLVQISPDQKEAPNLQKLLKDPSITKLFHFARFDVALLKQTFGDVQGPFYCTKIASKLARTFTDRHGLKDLCRDLLGIDISKAQQTSDWGSLSLSEDQRLYAATDVLYLHRLKEVLDTLLARENRHELAKSCFDFLSTCTDLDLIGFPDLGVFRH